MQYSPYKKSRTRMYWKVIVMNLGPGLWNQKKKHLAAF
jgi:hypothetical protein